MVLLVEGEGGGGEEGGWRLCQALQFTSDPRFMRNGTEKSFRTPLSLVL